MLVKQDTFGTRCSVLCKEVHCPLSEASVLCWEVCPLFGVSFIRGLTVIALEREFSYACELL